MKGQKIKISLAVLIDLILLYAALYIVLYLRYYPEYYFGTLIKTHLSPFTLIFILWILIFGAFGLYDLKFLKNTKYFLYRLLQAVTAGTVLAIVIFYLIPIFGIEPRRNLLLISLLAALLIFIWRYIFNALIIRTGRSRILFFGVNPEITNLADYLLKNPQLGYTPLGFITNSNSEPLYNTHLPIYLADRNLPHLLKDLAAEAVIITGEIKENKTLVQILFQVIPLGISVLEFDRFYEMLTGKIPLSLIKEVWFLENLTELKNDFYEFSKRVLDILLALILVIPALISHPLIALAIKLDSEGPVFYRQKRVGKNGKIFWLFKYRSMIQGADKIDGLKRDGKDARHTRVGSLLRKIYLDELPQIWNILKGEMSFVGPRPERPEYIEDLKAKIPFYEIRLLVSPGLTGWAQINMENDASVEDAPEKLQYDLYYIKNRSFILDLLIILRTIFIILRREGR